MTIEELKAGLPEDPIGDDSDTARVRWLIGEVERAAAIREELKNEPCGDALDLLWKEIILSRNPNYGDWEYPGMAYRHLKAEFDSVRHHTARECAEIVAKWGYSQDHEAAQKEIREKFELE